jgi:peptide-methionine (S)-S-oxide reductase
MKMRNTTPPSVVPTQLCHEEREMKNSLVAFQIAAPSHSFETNGYRCKTLDCSIGASNPSLLQLSISYDQNVRNKIRMESASMITSTSLTMQREATFGMGCFWKPAEELLKVPGVIDTVVGYTGNEFVDRKKPPTYDDVCFGSTYVEAVRVYFDDERLSYEQLLENFFLAQEPRLGSRQYASKIFPHDDMQEEIARHWLEVNRIRRRPDNVPVNWTTIENRTPFFKAENYHQRYWEKTRPRFIIMIALLVVSTGTLDNGLMHTAISAAALHTASNVIILAGCLFALVERKLDTNVVALD